MKRFLFSLLTLATFLVVAVAQQAGSKFTGAKAKDKQYKALYVVNTSDEKHITATLRNISNVLNDPRLKGKLTVELVAFGDGVALYQKSGPFEEKLNDLKAWGVITAQCENTIRERKIDKSALFGFVQYVPSGNGEIVIRSAEGWAIVHP
ncbi:MAG: DsrE family protein [Mucilaginibacter polytrichastri]|nr:DsrE family protein [Mucilaginibacter polytrichastri]